MSKVKGYTRRTQHGIVTVKSYTRSVGTPSSVKPKTVRSQGLKEYMAHKASQRSKKIRAARAAALAKHYPYSKY